MNSVGGGKPFVTEIPSYEEGNLETARMTSPMDKTRIVHFSPAETLRMMRDMESPSPDLKGKVNPFFIRQIQSNTSNNLRSRMNHFRASVAENPDDPNSMDIKRIKYEANQAKPPKSFVNSINIDDTTKYMSKKDALSVKSYGKPLTGMTNNELMNPGQYGEASKDHDDPFIFETRVLLLVKGFCKSNWKNRHWQNMIR